MRIETFVPMEVPTATHNDLVPARRWDGHWQIAKGPRLRAAEERWEAHLAPALEGMERPLEGAVRAEVRFAFRAGGGHLPGEPHTGKPDLDNVEKAFWDALERLGAVRDDRMVFDKRVSKLWAEVPGVYLALEEVEAE